MLDCKLEKTSVIPFNDKQLFLIKHENNKGQINTIGSLDPSDVYKVSRMYKSMTVIPNSNREAYSISFSFENLCVYTLYYFKDKLSRDVAFELIKAAALSKDMATKIIPISYHIFSKFHLSKKVVSTLYKFNNALNLKNLIVSSFGNNYENLQTINNYLGINCYFEKDTLAHIKKYNNFPFGLDVEEFVLKLCLVIEQPTLIKSLDIDNMSLLQFVLKKQFNYSYEKGFF